MIAPPPSPITKYVMLVYTSSLTIFVALVQIALYRISKKCPAFVLFFSSGIAALWCLLWHTLFYCECIYGRSFRQSNNWYAWSWEFPHLTIYLHNMVISYNRAHAIFFPLQYSHFWTKKVAIIVATLCWGFALGKSCWDTLPVEPWYMPMPDIENTCESKSDPRLIEHPRNEEKYGKNMWDIVTCIHLATTISYVTYVAVCCLLVSKFLEKRLFSKQISDGAATTAMERKRHIRLWLICFGFTVALPLFMRAVPTYPVPEEYVCITSYALLIFNNASEALFLFAFSSLVKPEMPFRKYFVKTTRVQMLHNVK